jgi:hypothetical protein
MTLSEQRAPKIPTSAKRSKAFAEDAEVDANLRTLSQVKTDLELDASQRVSALENCHG